MHRISLAHIEFAFVNILVHSYLTKKYLMIAPMLSFIFVLAMFGFLEWWIRWTITKAD